MPRDATPTERAVCACSREKFRYDDDFEMLDPAQMVDPFKIWENVNEYLRLYCQGQKKVEAAEKSFWLPPQGSWKRGLWSWTRAPKQMWSMAKNPALEQSLDHLRPLFLEPLTKNCLVKTQGGFLANVPQTCQVGDLVNAMSMASCMDFWLGVDMLSRHLMMYVWTHRGQLKLSACYNQAFYAREFVEEFLNKVKHILLEGLEIQDGPRSAHIPETTASWEH
ncbi:hypothetical protein IMSHALPRED_002305 [Imshaugia aleurites]|uniref:Uncharacterized protein n=1 Tax=Imshaugia aleurites TaxID=172621 RepID=A0A8H3F0L1_9LECA|nr:hypothetical protein IMSHALPRED_002305 [Imshaugia aleurites]